MTDDSDTDSEDRSTPGGGPNRVVSETSVDDILDSITSSPEPKRDDSDEEIDRSEKTKNRDEQTIGTTDPNRDARATSSHRENETEPSSDLEFDTTVGGDSGPETATIETGRPADPASVIANADPSSGPDGNSDPAPVPDDDTTTDGTGREPAFEDTEPDLSSRIERGDVTGSDVRAAEAGEGREETTDIGDIELSMVDIDSTIDGSGSASSAARSSTDGPLSGSIGSPDAEPEDGESGGTERAETDGSSSGLLGRLKRLFSR